VLERSQRGWYDSAVLLASNWSVYKPFPYIRKPVFNRQEQKVDLKQWREE
jgi:hypothetical protein